MLVKRMILKIITKQKGELLCRLQRLQMRRLDGAFKASEPNASVDYNYSFN